MSSPILTRLGVNQFWYKHWVSDKHYNSKNQISYSIPIILEFFINYGFTRINNPHVHEYWFKPKVKKDRTLPSRFYMHYYKRHFYSHEILGIEHTFLIRHRTGEYFPFKTWYLSYNNWIIVCMHWFKPNKKRRKYNPLLDHNYLISKNNVIKNSKNTTQLNTRRLALAYSSKATTFKPLAYSF